MFGNFILSCSSNAVIKIEVIMLFNLIQHY
uniref:Uncharacterized protein n=1 Tax=Anguilla anguilla TaxID=7936 RepID=A0A0E9Q545_ANGAN